MSSLRKSLVPRGKKNINNIISDNDCQFIGNRGHESMYRKQVSDDVELIISYQTYRSGGVIWIAIKLIDQDERTQQRLFTLWNYIPESFPHLLELAGQIAVKVLVPENKLKVHVS